MAGLIPYYRISNLWRLTGESSSPAQSAVVKINKLANGYRLPTMAEWEWAASGGVLSQGFKYSGSDNIDEVAWYGANSGGNPHQVASSGDENKKKPNELGLYDMSGNYWEWCFEERLKIKDVDDPKYDEEYDLFYPDNAFPLRCIRGGDWIEDPSMCEVKYKRYYSANGLGDNVTIRLVRGA